MEHLASLRRPVSRARGPARGPPLRWRCQGPFSAPTRARASLVRPPHAARCEATRKLRPRDATQATREPDAAERLAVFLVRDGPIWLARIDALHLDSPGVGVSGEEADLFGTNVVEELGRVRGEDKLDRRPALESLAHLPEEGHELTHQVRMQAAVGLLDAHDGDAIAAAPRMRYPHPLRGRRAAIARRITFASSGLMRRAFISAAAPAPSVDLTSVE
jgi:hypothetical protein